MYILSVYLISFGFIFEGPFLLQVDVNESEKTVNTLCANHFDDLNKGVNLLLHDFMKSNIYLQKIYTEYTQKNGAVSKGNKKFISHLTRAQRTPSAAATVQVSHALITVLQCVHPGSHDTHPHGNVLQCVHPGSHDTHPHGNHIHPTLANPFPAATPSWKLAPQ